MQIKLGVCHYIIAFDGDYYYCRSSVNHTGIQIPIIAALIVMPL